MLRVKTLILNIRRFVSNSLGKHMEAHCVVPDVIDKSPHKIVKVLYPDGIQVYPGSILTPTETQHEPLLTWECDPKAYHVVCMTDPDAPSRTKPDDREWQHWLLGNILGCKQSTGKTLSEYIGCGPPKGSGLHRYVFLVYRQKEEIVFDEYRLSNKSAKGRSKFSIRAFAEKYCLGEPIAGNFFQAAYDDYVPILYRRLKI